MTVANVNKGLIHLREYLAKVEGVSYVAQTGPGGGAAVTTDSLETRNYCKKRAQIAATQLKRVHDGSVAPMVKRAPTPADKLDATTIERNLLRVIEDVEAFGERVHVS